MNKKFFIYGVATAALLVIIGVIIFAQNKPQNNSLNTSSVSHVAGAGIYTDYSSDSLTRYSGKDKVVFFKASWCPDCNATDKNISSNLDKIPENTVILKTDYDTSTDLKRKYGVTTQHTFVYVDNSGNQLTKWSGTISLDDILNQVKNYKLSNSSISSQISSNNLSAGNSQSVITAGVYTDYQGNSSLEANSDKRKILFFKASWCPDCNATDKNINANLNNIPGDVAILKVDYDNSQDLKKKYGITVQHTFVQVDNSGNLVKKWSGTVNLSDILKQI